MSLGITYCIIFLHICCSQKDNKATKLNSDSDFESWRLLQEGGGEGVGAEGGREGGGGRGGKGLFWKEHPNLSLIHVAACIMHIPYALSLSLSLSSSPFLPLSLSP